MRFAIPCFLFAALGLIVALFPAGVTHALNPNHDCSFCHGLHQAAGTRLTREADVEVLCLTCHGPAGISTFKADVHTNGRNSQYPPFRISCMTCHNPHDDRANRLGPHFHDRENIDVDGINIKLVGRRLDASREAAILTPNSGIRKVVFEFRGREIDDVETHSFADDDEDNDGIWDGACEVCHTLTKHHRNNESGGHSHNRGRSCTNCHAHVDNFIP